MTSIQGHHNVQTPIIPGIFEWWFVGKMFEHE
jgi:hypothetical protein